MKILFYNWTPLGGPAGGGVADYLVELVGEWLEKRPQDDIWFLNSGRRYDAGNIRIERSSNCYGEKVTSYEVINSPILAPGRQSPLNFERYLNDAGLMAKISGFIIDKGPFDAIHLHNIEGLSLGALRFKEYCRETKIILTMHNYFPLCPQVNLWRGDSENCAKDFNRQCQGCFSYSNYDLTKFRFSHLDVPELKEIFSEYSGEKPDDVRNGVYEEYISKTRNAINENMDYILCVSKRSRDIAISAGMDSKKTFVSYAGSRIASLQKGFRRNKNNNNDEPLRLVYLGYPSKEKGFDFFVDASSEFVVRNPKKIAVTIVSRMSKDRLHDTSRRLGEMAFSSSNVINGYESKEVLEDILMKQDLGVVPVLWEDNLPRVAMEMYAYGLPIFTSDAGGAKEISGYNKRFVFKAGHMEDYISKLLELTKHKEYLDSFFERAIKLRTMDEHIEELVGYYEAKK